MKIRATNNFRLIHEKWRIGVLLILGAIAVSGRTGLPETATQVDRLPVIDPDYTQIVIPPNIAPLNFAIKEKGEAFLVSISGENGNSIQIEEKEPVIHIPLKSWKKLLAANTDGEVQYRIYVRDKGDWKQYLSFSNDVASDKIDSRLYYRLIEPQFNYWREMGIYARNLENFDETCFMHNRLTENNCMNCHTFFQNRPDRMLFHMRAGEASGTYLFRENKLVKINTSTDFNKAGAYATWHPSGEFITFSVNKLTQFFHAKGEIRDVMDWASDLICYHIATNTVSTFPSIASLNRSETFPAWSHDGRYLYFCSAPKLEAFVTKEEDLKYRQIRYDLMRIEFFLDTGEWGPLEMVVDSDELKKSITMPRPSPDGNFLVFCTADYGNFPIFRSEADLYMLDIKSGQTRRLETNSDRADTFHSWSSNSRWMVFSSKRRDGLRARPYFTFVDETGTVSKPFLLPQKDPGFYLTFFKTYNRPELVTGPVDLRWQDILKTAYDAESEIKANLDPKVKVDRTTGATPMSENMGRPVPK